MALYRLLDAATALSNDERITRLFTLVPGSDFGVDVFSAIESIGGRTVPWVEACSGSYDLVLAASPKGDLHLLRGKHVLLPHGAGYNKSIPGEGSDSASGLDAAFLNREAGGVPIALHAVAHPDQVARIAAADQRAADRAEVIGDPTLERFLASRPLRDQYRTALDTGPRTLVALASTWGAESLLRRHPDLPGELAARLPYDEYQLALIVHPNEQSLLGGYELTQRLASALDAGMVLAGTHEEWASVLIAADALVTDHGSAALYYCATDDRPVVSLYGDGAELIPGSPMHSLLHHIPRLASADALKEALRAYRPGSGRCAVHQAFAHQGRALSLLRTALYTLLDLTPPAHGSPPRPLSMPRPADRTPTAFDVDADAVGHHLHVTRRPAGMGVPGHHLAVEHGVASERLVRSAGLLYRRPVPASDSWSALAWTADDWARHALSAYPGCRSAAAILSPGLLLFRTRGHDHPYAVQVEPWREGGRVVRMDPAAAASAVHAWFLARTRRGACPARLKSVIGDRTFGVTVRPATHSEAMATL
ncbi:translation initiation factor 2 [Streptomyces sp. NPDC091377]|uniref:translation initiation factor 2 n=1 Tax=Streptomyces sp. NPDC091377 TaxID=3365995 RepID=UPI0037F7BAF2